METSTAVFADDDNEQNPAGVALDGSSARTSGSRASRARRSRWIAPLLLALVLLAALATPVRHELEASVLPQDEGLLLVYPERMMHGDVPNRDFESVYGPGSLWAVAAGFEVGTVALTTERWVGFVYHLVLVGALAALAWRRRGGWAALVAGAVSIVLLAPFGLVAWAWLGAAALGAVGLLLFDVGLAAGRRGWFLGAGVALGLVLSFRLDLGVSVALVLLALGVTQPRRLRVTLVGVGVGLLPLLLNVAQAGPAAVVRGQIIEPIFRSGPSRRLPLGNLDNSELTLLVLCVVVALAWTAVGIREARRERAAPVAAISLMIGAFELGMLPQAFQRADWLHVGYVACFVLATAPMFPWKLSRRLPVWVWPAVAGAVVVSVAWSMSGNAYQHDAARSLGIDSQPDFYRTASVSHRGRSVPVSVVDRDNVTQVLRAVSSRFPKGARLFVGPRDLRRAIYNDTYLYYLLPEFQPSSYYLEMNPRVANGSDSRLASDIGRSDVLILSTRWNDFGPAGARTTGPDAPNRVVAKEFTRFATWGPWQLFARKR